MPDDLKDEKQAGESSTLEDEKAGESSTADSDVTPGSSAENESPSDDTSEKDAPAQSLTDVVKAALDAKSSPDAETEEGKASEGDDAPAKEESDADAELPDEVTEEELSRYPGSTQKRIKQLLKDRADARTERDELQKPAEAWSHMTTFLREKQIPADSFQTSVQVLAAYNEGDYEKAYSLLLPTIQALETRLGLVLPQDLKDAVEAGETTEAQARETAKLRGKSETQAEILERNEQTREANDRQTQVANVVQVAVQTAANWETSKKSTDPDWSLKANMIQRSIQAEVLKNGYPSTPQAVTKMLDDIHKEVTDQIVGIRGTQQTTVKNPESTGPKRTVPEPKSTLDAVRNALAGG